MWRHKYSTTSSPWKRTDNTAKRPTPFRVEKAKFEKKRQKYRERLQELEKQVEAMKRELQNMV
jgi:Skp family chaperone for outer membrane proteins